MTVGVMVGWQKGNGSLGVGDTAPLLAWVFSDERVRVDRRAITPITRKLTETEKTGVYCTTRAVVITVGVGENGELLARSLCVSWAQCK